MNKRTNSATHAAKCTHGLLSFSRDRHADTAVTVFPCTVLLFQEPDASCNVNATRFFIRFTLCVKTRAFIRREAARQGACGAYNNNDGANMTLFRQPAGHSAARPQSAAEVGCLFCFSESTSTLPRTFFKDSRIHQNIHHLMHQQIFHASANCHSKLYSASINFPKNTDNFLQIHCILSWSFGRAASAEPLQVTLQSPMQNTCQLNTADVLLITWCSAAWTPISALAILDAE